MSMIVISFDGLKDTEFEKMANQPDVYPNIAKFKTESIYEGGVKTVFVSNTYPIHTTIATGKLPKDHGVISNYIDTKAGRRWAQLASYIKSETIWDAARKKGLTVASILWPVTCGANIKWNMPEVHIHGKENQLVESLRHGSFLFQVQAFLRHGKKINGFTPLGLDDFSTSVACDLLKKNRPDLTLIHLLAYDSTSHRYGSQSEALDEARKSLDKSLGRILEVTDTLTDSIKSKNAEDMTVLIFSDHGHIDVSETINLKQIFGENVYDQCGGSAFLKSAKPVNMESAQLESAEPLLQTESFDEIKNYPWFGRFLTEQEMKDSGYINIEVCGIAAKKGYCFIEDGQHKSSHGYPIDYENYSTFYAIRNKYTLLSSELSKALSPTSTELAQINCDLRDKHFSPLEPRHGDLRDITAIMSKMLDLDFDS